MNKHYIYMDRAFQLYSADILPEEHDDILIVEHTLDSDEDINELIAAMESVVTAVFMLQSEMLRNKGKLN